MSTFTLELPTSQQQDVSGWAAVAFMASYSSEATRRSYTPASAVMAWCTTHHLDPLADIRRPHVKLYARELDARGLAAATVALKLVVLTGFYRYCVEEQLLEHSPAVHVRRPKVSEESTRIGLDRNELGALLVQAGLSGGNDHVVACLLGLNALRVSEACGADLADLRSPTATGRCGSWAKAPNLRSSRSPHGPHGPSTAPSGNAPKGR